ncbi:MAG: hypothetical protein OHK0021_19030 [Bryobacter sp.]
MQPNPQTLRDELIAAATAEGFGLFHCEPNSIPVERSLWWDVALHPDYREFFTAAKFSAVKVIYFFEHEFTERELERVEDYLEIAALEEAESRQFRRRLADLRGYKSFLCRVAAGYLQDGLIHWYEVYAPWFLDYIDLLEEVQDAAEEYSGLDEDEDDEGDPPLGGYYSRN